MKTVIRTTEDQMANTRILGDMFKLEREHSLRLNLYKYLLDELDIASMYLITLNRLRRGINRDWR